MGTSRRNNGHGARRAVLLGAALITGLGSLDCRTGCSGGRTDEPREVPKLVRRVHLAADAAPFAADITSEGDTFLVAGGRGPVALWNTSSGPGGDVPFALVPVGEPLTSAQFARVDDRVMVFTATEARGTVGLWSWPGNDGGTEATASFEHTYAVRSGYSALSADGRFLALGGVVFDLRTAEQLGEPVQLATQSALAVAESGTRVVLAGFHEPWVAVRDLPGGAVRRWQAPDKVTAVAIDARGALIAALTRDGHLHLWRQPSGESAGDLPGAASGGGLTGRGLQFVAGGSQLVLADEAGVSLFDVQSRRKVWHAAVDGGLSSFACRGSVAVGGTAAGAALVWDLARHAVVARVQTSPTAVTAIAVNERRHLVLAADQNGDATLWRW